MLRQVLAQEVERLTEALEILPLNYEEAHALEEDQKGISWQGKPQQAPVGAGVGKPTT